MYWEKACDFITTPSGALIFRFLFQLVVSHRIDVGDMLGFCLS